MKPEMNHSGESVETGPRPPFAHGERVETGANQARVEKENILQAVPADSLFDVVVGDKSKEAEDLPVRDVGRMLPSYKLIMALAILALFGLLVIAALFKTSGSSALAAMPRAQAADATDDTEATIQVAMMDFFSKTIPHKHLISALIDDPEAPGGKTQYDLELPDTLPHGQFMTGDKVVLKGKKTKKNKANVLVVEKMNIKDRNNNEGKSTNGHGKQQGRRRTQGAIIVRTVMIMVLRFVSTAGSNDYISPNGVTHDGMMAQALGTLAGNTNSLADIWSRCSFGNLQANFNGTLVGDYSASPSTAAYYVNVPTKCISGVGDCTNTYDTTQSCGSAEYYGVPQYALQFLERTKGISRHNWQHKVVVHDKSSACFNWLGLGNVGCDYWYCYSWYPMDYLFTAELFAHEMGHNLGLPHAGVTDAIAKQLDLREQEYGDQSCAMGYNWNLRCYNAPHAASIGYLQPVTLSMENLCYGVVYKTELNSMSETISHASIKITPTWISTSGSQVVPYWIQFKTPANYDVTIGNSASGNFHPNYNPVQVKSQPGLSSKHMAMMGFAGVWNDSSLDLVVKLHSVTFATSTGSSKATVSVQRGFCQKGYFSKEISALPSTCQGFVRCLPNSCVSALDGTRVETGDAGVLCRNNTNNAVSIQDCVPGYRFNPSAQYTSNICQECSSCPTCGTCFDGLWSMGEEGIDCGGPICDECLPPPKYPKCVVVSGSAVAANNGKYVLNAAQPEKNGFPNYIKPDGSVRIYTPTDNTAMWVMHPYADSAGIWPGQTSYSWGHWTTDVTLAGYWVYYSYTWLNDPLTINVCPCQNGVQDVGETGVDCGGNCPACISCSNQVADGHESDVDCGGDTCGRCTAGKNCRLNSDCANALTCDCGTCTAPVDIGFCPCPSCGTCTDGVWSHGEEGVDCGGDLCNACPSGAASVPTSAPAPVVPRPCIIVSGADLANNNGQYILNVIDGPVKNGYPNYIKPDRTIRMYVPTSYPWYWVMHQWVDDAGIWGGMTHYSWSLSQDVTQAVWWCYYWWPNWIWDPLTITVCPCFNGVKDSNENGVDCGGPCAPCPCNDLLLNNAESDIDCGGKCKGCTYGKKCRSNVDCAAGLACNCGTCKFPKPYSECSTCPTCGTCKDGLWSMGEEQVDCGGPICDSCLSSTFNPWQCVRVTGAAPSSHNGDYYLDTVQPVKNSFPNYAKLDKSLRLYTPTGQATWVIHQYVDQQCCYPGETSFTWGHNQDVTTPAYWQWLPVWPNWVQDPMVVSVCPCYNGVKDIGEEGVDCGGSCPACIGKNCRLDKDCDIGLACTCGACLNGTHHTTAVPAYTEPTPTNTTTTTATPPPATVAAVAAAPVPMAAMDPQEAPPLPDLADLPTTTPPGPTCDQQCSGCSLDLCEITPSCFKLDCASFISQSSCLDHQADGGCVAEMAFESCADLNQNQCDGISSCKWKKNKRQCKGFHEVMVTCSGGSFCTNQILGAPTSTQGLTAPPLGTCLKAQEDCKHDPLACCSGVCNNGPRGTKYCS
eukprot:gb/GEZN01000113.1/.p1 GENE.gb/GEZN01000113.1/~~gb/GEZN01000113.1/.p1  ORF type:complete len:1515 (-),score=132.07 gb/GEZN01000113.1/:2359-6903(-)